MTFTADSIQITAIDNDLLRFARRERSALPGICPEFDERAAESLAFYQIARQVLAPNIDDPLLNEVQTERFRRGFSAAKHVGKGMNWLSERDCIAEPRERKAKKERLPRCRRCHRRLTDPVSIARGIGPECYALEGGK